MLVVKRSPNILLDWFSGVSGVAEKGGILEILVFAGFVLGKWQVEEKYPGSENQVGNYFMYHDLMARIKNAEMVNKKSVLMPFSRVDFEIVKVLVEAGYLKDAQKKKINKKNVIDIKLAYMAGRPAIKDFKFFSRPGRRFYLSSKELRPVKSGYGIAVISTSKGIMNNKEAKKIGIGGEYLFQVW